MQTREAECRTAVDVPTCNFAYTHLMTLTLFLGKKPVHSRAPAGRRADTQSTLALGELDDESMEYNSPAATTPSSLTKWTREEIVFDLLFLGGLPPIEECGVEEEDLPVLMWAKKYWVEGSPKDIMTLVEDPSFHAQVQAAIDMLDAAYQKRDEVDQNYALTRRGVQLVSGEVMGQLAKLEDMLTSGSLKQDQHAKRKQCIIDWGNKQSEKIESANTELLKVGKTMQIHAAQAVLATWDALQTALGRIQPNEEDMLAALTADLDKSLNQLFERDSILTPPCPTASTGKDQDALDDIDGQPMLEGLPGGNGLHHDQEGACAVLQDAGFAGGGGTTLWPIGHFSKHKHVASSIATLDMWLF